MVWLENGLKGKDDQGILNATLRRIYEEILAGRLLQILNFVSDWGK